MSKKDFKNYFNRQKNIGGYFFLIVGILFLLQWVSNMNNSSPIVLSLIMIAWGGKNVYHSLKYQSDQAVDEYCKRQTDQYYKEKKMLIDTYKVAVESESYSSGYLFENIFSARLSRIGKDEVKRSSIFEITCAFLTNDMIYYYGKKFSLITDEKFENQREFYIGDIKMVSIEEIDHSWSVAVLIPGSEKIYLKCKDRTTAIEICEKIKQKL